MRIAVYSGTAWQEKHTKGFARWYVHNYIPKNIRPQLSVSVCLYNSKDEWSKVASDKKDLGYCEYMEEDRLLGREHCRITLYSPRNILYYKFLVRVAHEFIHVKQYVTHELKDCSGGTRYKKQKFDDSLDYWDSPWELEALGLETRLVKLYCEESKIKDVVFNASVCKVID